MTEPNDGAWSTASCAHALAGAERGLSPRGKRTAAPSWAKVLAAYCTACGRRGDRVARRLAPLPSRGSLASFGSGTPVIHGGAGEGRRPFQPQQTRAPVGSRGRGRRAPSARPWSPSA